MTKNRTGFTLIELVVVVLIMGILASMGLPYYYKTIETSRAGDAVALGHLIGNSNRMYKIDNPSAAISGAVTNACNSAVSCSAAAGACKLIACGYVAQQDWNQSSYNFYACNGAAGGGYCGNLGTELGVASTRRKAGAGTPYSNWGYRFYNSGRCESVGGAPSCPKF